MTHGLVGTNKTRLNVEIVSTSVKQQHYDSMFASIKQRHMASKLTTMACELLTHGVLQNM